MSAPSERTFRWNLAMLLGDTVGFTVGLALLGPTTILPSLVRELGGGPLAVGLIGAIQAGGYFLPQLVAGRWVANRALVKKYVVLPATLSRTCLALLPPALWLLAARSSALALAAVLLTYTAFNVIDALSAVGWYDLLAKVIPLERRGRVLGAGQSLSALLGVGAGGIVTWILSHPGPSTQSYVLILLLAVAFLAICPIALALIREPRSLVKTEEPLCWGEYFPRLGSILRRDDCFAWLVAVMWLGGLADMAAAFYVLYASERIGIPQETTGLFISAGVVGSFVSGALLGPLGDRHGSAAAIKVVMGVRFLCPLLALLMPLLAGRHLWLASGAFLLLFAFVGLVAGSYQVGHMNHVLEIAPPDERAMYVALANTLNGLLVVAPLLAGWLVSALSYGALFTAALAAAAVGVVVAMRRPKRASAGAVGESTLQA